MRLLKLVLGLMLVFVYHLPRLVYHLLMVSYAAIFNRVENLTADPNEHLRRAYRILHRGKNSELLYATVELRFALERMADQELVMAGNAANRALQEYDPVKKIASLRRLDPATAEAHDVVVVNRETGDEATLGQYTPLDKIRVESIKGRLGDLLHPKRGPRLGIADEPWYLETRRFLTETHQYLSRIAKSNIPFFAFEGIEHVELRKPEP